MKLNHTQKKYLRSLAQSKKPVLMIGQNGITDAVLEELDDILAHHELIKIKIRSEDKAEKQTMVDVLLTHSKAICVQVVGGVLVLYKPLEPLKIILPK